MPNEPERFVQARYIGMNTIHRSKLQGSGYDGQGRRRTTLAIEQGDVLMMPEREILGQTLLFDPRGVNPPQDLGTGKRVKPEHAGFSAEDLAMCGYEFHSGRQDFEVVVSAEPVVMELVDMSDPLSQQAEEKQPSPTPTKKRG
jgi:hypothetical protein